MKTSSLLAVLLTCTGLSSSIGGVMAQDFVTMEASNPVPGRELRINYDMKMGGFSLGSGRFRATFTDDHYVASTNLRTDGLADFLFQSTYATASEGAVEGDAIYPSSYFQDFDGRGDEYQIVHIGYENVTPYLVEADPSYGRRLERFPVTEEQRENSYDPLNAAVHLITGMTFSDELPCGETIQIFDGRRRYNLKMTHEGTRDISVRNGEVWDGEVTVCKLSYEEVAGFKPQPEDEDLPRPPLTLFIAEIEEGFYIPVQVRAPTPIGHMVLSASHFRVRDVEVAATQSNETDATNLAPTN